MKVRNIASGKACKVTFSFDIGSAKFRRKTPTVPTDEAAVRFTWQFYGAVRFTLNQLIRNGWSALKNALSCYGNGCLLLNSRSSYRCHSDAL